MKHLKRLLPENNATTRGLFGRCQAPARKGNGTIFYMSARTTAKSSYKSIFDWTRPDSLESRCSASEDFEAYTLGYLRGPECNLSFGITRTTRIQLPESVAETKAHGRAFLRTRYPPQVKMINSGGEQHPLDNLEGKRVAGKILDQVHILGGGFWPKVNHGRQYSKPGPAFFNWSGRTSAAVSHSASILPGQPAS